MLLVELNINGTTNYLSIDGHALIRYWEPKIVSFDPPQYSMEKKYGGFVKPVFGNISLFQNLFDNDWTPPTACQIAIRYNDDTALTELSAVTLFTGTAHLKKMDRTAIQYGLYTEVISSGITMPANTEYNNVSLKDVFTSAATSLGLNLNTAFARSSSTEVEFTVSNDEEILTFLSKLSASMSHLYYIKEGDINLIDMFQDNGTTTVTEFDYFPSTMEMEPSIIAAKTTQFGYLQSGLTYPYAKETKVDAFVGDVASVSLVVNNIWDTWNKPRYSLKMPLIGPIASTPGMRIQFTDTSQTEDVSAYIRVRNIRYNFDKEEITAIGEGEITNGAV